MSRNEDSSRQRHRKDPAEPTPVRSGRWAIPGAIAILIVGGIWLFGPRDWFSSGTAVTENPKKTDSSDQPKPVPEKPKSKGSFLDQFQGEESKPATAELSNAELEAQLMEILKQQDRIAELKRNIKQEPPEVQVEHVMEGRALAARLNDRLETFQSSLKLARKKSEDDPVVQWLTGELLMSVGGEPVEVLPYFEKAAAGNLKRPRLFANLARARYEANQFDLADQAAHSALEMDNHDRYVWETFTRIEMGVQRFDEILKQQDLAFPELPDWASKDRERAAELLANWREEERIREAEAKADNLPRVRLLVANRKFEQQPDGKVTVETTGEHEVILELFEDNAPQTVASFINLVEQGFFDGTSFHLSQPGHMVVGGDPNTKNDDPDDDGNGGPGYILPDEYELPNARRHFRGSLSMVNTGPGTAGSQFFITLVPYPGIDKHFTVFGRVLEGQTAVDGITPGRTTTRIGKSGKVIPGDLLLKATVIRKRDHEYTFEKLPQRKAE